MQQGTAPVKRSAQPTKTASAEPKKNVVEYLDNMPAVEKTTAEKILSTKFKEKKHQVNERKVVHYRLKKKNGAVCILPTSGFDVFDGKQRREVRYCTNEKSLFVDEQSSFGKRQPVVFRDGELFVSPEYPTLLQLMDMHPENVKNGGSLFQLVEKEKTAEKTIEDEYAISDAITAIKNTDITDLYPVAMEFGVDLEQSNKEIKRDLIVIAKAQPQSFMRSLGSPATKLRAMIRQAADFGILRLDNSGAYWADSNGLITNNVLGKDIVETFAAFLTTGKGEPVFDKIKSELDNIK